MSKCREMIRFFDRSIGGQTIFCRNRKIVFFLCLCFLMSATIPAGAALQGLWKLDETSGTSAADSSGNSRTGTLQNMAGNEWDTGIIDGALEFDGTNDYISMPRVSVLETGNSSTHYLSATAWIKDYSGGAAGWGTIAGTGDGGWLLARDGNDGLLGAYWLTSGGLVTSGVSNLDISDGEWHYAALVYNGSSVSLYVDDERTTTTTSGGTIQNIYNKGVLVGENAGATGRYWDGVLDDVRIYDHALTGAEVAQMYGPGPANASFEYPNISGHAYNPSGIDWSYATGNFTLSHNGSAYSSTAYSGDQVVVLQNVVSISQAISGFEVGQDYVVSWAEANRPSPYGGNDFRVLMDTTVIYATHTVPSTSWTVREASFTATSTTHTLKFDALNTGGGDKSVFIDDVMIEEDDSQTPPGAASSPSPANSATGVSVTADLSWTAGSGADSHNVYFGTSSPGTSRGNQTATTYDTGTMSTSTTYYWRIDEVNDYGTTTGTVWSFTTTSSTINAVGYWTMNDNAASTTVLDSVGSYSGTFVDSTNPYTSYHHSTDCEVGSGSLSFDGVNDYISLPRASVLETGNASTHRLSASAWIKDTSGGASGWGNVIGTGDGGWLLARNGSSGMLAAFWLSSGGLVTASSSTNISDGRWHHVVMTYDGSAVHLYVDEVHTSTSTSGGSIQNLYNKGVLIGENAGATGRYWKGLLDDVRIYDYAVSATEVEQMYTPGHASSPGPANGATGVSPSANLSWAAGVTADSHNVYFGTSSPGTYQGNQTGATFNPGTMSENTTYYWRIDEVDTYGTTTGTVWSFTTGTDTSVSTATGYWSMDDNAASTTVLDSASGGYNGTFVDSTNPYTNYHHNSSCQEGTGSLYFDGVNDYITMTRNSVLETGNASTHRLSVSVWIKSDYTSAPSGYTTIVGTGDGGWFLGTMPNQNQVTFACWLLNGSSGQTVTVTNSTAVFDGQWHQVIGVYDGSSIHIYVDDNHSEASTIGGTIRNINNKAVYAGENAGATGRYWKGLIDGVGIYDYDLFFESAGDFSIVFPGTSWQTKTPSELGLDSSKLDQFATNIGGMGCIIRQGYVVKTWGDQTNKADWASSAKPVTTTLLFYAIEEGLLDDVYELIKDHGWSLITKDQTMQFYHLANMTSGYARGEAPGAAWAYNDYAITLYVKTLFDNVYGTTPNTAATNANRLGALGFQDGSLYGSRYGYGVETSVRDFARIGWLWCNKGYWNGQQLLPRWYFDEYMKAQVPSSLPRTTTAGTDYLGIGTYGGGSDQTGDGPGVYGFNWWCNDDVTNWPDAPADTVQANGHWGAEVVTVIPSLSLVVAYKGGDTRTHSTGSSSSEMNQDMKLLVEACPEFPMGQIMVDENHPNRMVYHAIYENGQEKPVCFAGPGDPEDFFYNNTSGNLSLLTGRGARCTYITAVLQDFGGGNPGTGTALDTKLTEWEGYITQLENAGVITVFFFFDDSQSLTSNWQELVDKCVAKFKHHELLIWSVAEEYGEALTTAQVSQVAARIKAQDERNHIVGVHQNHGNTFNFMSDSNIDMFLMQLNGYTAGELHNAVKNSNANGSKILNMAEAEDHALQTRTNVRLWNWAAIMGGASGVQVLYMGRASDSADWNTVDKYNDCARLMDFMEATQLNGTTNYDSLARGNTDYVLANPGHAYIVYGDSGTSLGVNVTAGTYSVMWYDPADGDWVDQGNQTLSAGDNTFTKPGAIGSEAALYLELQ